MVFERVGDDILCRVGNVEEWAGCDGAEQSKEGVRYVLVVGRSAPVAGLLLIDTLYGTAVVVALRNEVR